MGLLIDFFLPMAVGIIMLSLGLGLTLRDFLRVFGQPKIFAVGLCCQIILFPIIALVVTIIFDMKGAIAIGLILLASCPAGNMSSLITKYARGDIALSVTLTAINSLLSIFTLPIVLIWAQRYFATDDKLTLDASAIFLRTFLLAFLPITLGVIYNQYASRSAAILRKHLSRLSLMLLCAIILGAVAANWALFTANLYLFSGALSTLFILATGTSYFIAHILGFGTHISKTISIEIGVQNGAIGILIAGLFTPDYTGFNDYSLASALYGVMMYFALAPLIFVFRRIGLVSQNI